MVPVGSGVAPQWNPATRVLTVAVPQAEIVRVQVSSGLDAGDLDIQGGWSLLKPTVPASVKNAAVDGRVWMVTPGLTLTLVHAVEKPLTAPIVQVGQDGMERLSGEEFCVLRGAIGNHAKSTGRLDIDAEWQEQVDDLGQDGPEDGVDGRLLRDGHTHVGDFELGATESPASVGRTTVRGNGLPTRHELRHQLGDTRHRLVSYRATATTRFREYFAPEVATTVGDDGVLLTQHRGDAVERHVPSSRRPDPARDRVRHPHVQLERGAHDAAADRWSQRTGDRTAGQGHHADPDRWAAGLPATTVVLLRRRRAARGGAQAPALAHLGPGRGEWDAGLRSGQVGRRTRRHAAVRAWHRARTGSQGRGGVGAPGPFARNDARGAIDATAAETLRAGVVEGLSSVTAQLGTHFVPLQLPAPADLLTVWGADPAYQSAGPGGGPYIHQFGQRVHVDTDVVPVEEVLSKVTVVGHRPAFDPGRGLWFADIALPSGAAYTPFVRLALCRYQEWSIPGHHMSKVVRAEMAQLPAPRTLQIRHLAALSVTLSGPAGSRSRVDHPDDRRAQLRVERRAVGATDLDWVKVAGPVHMSAAVGATGLGDVRWSGKIEPGQAPEGQELRLVVEEFESFPTDPDQDDPLESVFSTGGEFPMPMRERLVYVDHVPL